jgi:hypothetical protein
MTATAAPAYLGNPANVDPEEAFVASLSSCHMLGVRFRNRHRKNQKSNQRRSPANPFHQETGMQNLVVWHAERGYLVDFDPFGKQETTWSIDIGKAWVFGSFRDAEAAMRWLSGPLQILPRRTDHK